MPLSCPFYSHKITTTLENPVFPRVIFLSLETIYVCVDFLYVFVVFKNAVKFFKGFKVFA
nr:MAG TPA: hypothetical protein [Caudoviricetes sp.]